MLLFLLLAFCDWGVTQSGDFTIVALPDTQNEAQFFPEVLRSQTEWIVSHRAELNIQLVLSEGDIVNEGLDNVQQRNADTAFRTLDASGIPYLVTIGNHDYDGSNPKAARRVSGFNKWFGPSRFAGRPWFRGNFPAGSNENSFGIVDIGGKQLLVVAIEYYPRPESLVWAESILRANPDKEAIVLTHSYMFVDNTRVDRCDTHDMNASDATGDDVWAHLRSFPNVIMVVSGHLTSGQTSHRADVGNAGNLVNQVFTNYQTFPHGGDGWLRFFTFHPATDTISVQTFSPSLNRFRTDPANQFTMQFHNPRSVAGAGTISGLVRDSSTCRAVAGVTVKAGEISSVTDAAGHYALTLPPGPHDVITVADAWAPGSATETVADGLDSNLNFFLSPAENVPCAPGEQSPSVRICSPQDDQHVTSPVHLTVNTHDDAADVTELQVNVDGRLALTQHLHQFNTLLEMPVGHHSIKVDAHDAAGSTFSSVVDVFVDQPPNSAISLNATPTSAALRAGASAKFRLDVSGSAAIHETVSFACTGLPDGVSCEFDPPAVAAADLPAVVQMKVSTEHLHAAALSNRHEGGLFSAIASTAVLLIIVLGGSRRHGGKARLFCWAGVLIVLATFCACAGLVRETGTPKGTFPVQVVSTSGSMQGTTQITLTVQ